VQLAARLRDVPARAEHNLPVPRPEADLAFGDDRELVLQGVQVRRDEDTWLERVFHDRDRAAGVGAPQLEHDAEPGNDFADPALTRLYDGQRWRWWRAHVPSRSFGEHGCQ
jgi:hypothetical protein